ncbi:MAG: phage tail sheath family protein [Cyanobium sp.]
MTSSGLRKDRKTPGVYVTEFPAFPPTVSGVSTAVPCFIGYTAKAEDPVTKKQLTMQAVPVVSMAEYASYFGGGKSLAANYHVSFAANGSSSATSPDFKAMSAQLQDDKITLEGLLACTVALQAGDDLKSQYNMYLSMQMFYANGGGFCYVISVGDYNNDKTKEKLLQGLEEARALHDATMLVVPDACLLSDSDYGAVVTAMLGQAGALRNRMAILDLPQISTINDAKNFKTKADAFYSGISSVQDAFSYGAAYGPALQSSFFSAEDLDFQVLADPAGTDQPKCNLTMNHLLTSQAVSLYLSDPSKLNDVLDKIASAYPIEKSSTKPEALDSSKLSQICNADGRAILRKATGDDSFDVAIGALKCLATITLPLDAPATSPPTAGDKAGDKTEGGTGPGTGEDASQAQTQPPKDGNAAPGQPTKGLCAIRTQEGSTGSQINNANLDKYLNNATPFLQQVEQVVANRINITPPSALLAGVWTKSDANNGVWNAPANIPLNMVVRPLVLLNDQEQGDYNMPPNGQSISILRALPGRGTVVWGARTLDGNSNDTRYIQVRRTLIYIEQSVKRSLQSFVFAANDAKTWTTVTSMIGNFLTTLWQAGGLMGTKPEEAFSVACGVPTTMTGLDVLNGYMIVNVSLQLIRPAEFIELTFTQRMQGV